MLRAVADTNTVISGLLYRGREHDLLEAARDGRIALRTSTVLLAELADVLPRAKFALRIAAADMSVARIARRYARLAPRVVPAKISLGVPGDPDDDAVLACALAAAADLIVSGDKRLRNLKSWQRIPIVSAGEALEIVARQSARG
ncbi:MAG: putative toxin-antitoxin system toxin component, PIN family [Burkholderiales bacterium]